MENTMDAVSQNNQTSPAKAVEALLINTIKDAAAEIAKFEPEQIDFGYDKKVTVGKLPADRAGEGLVRFTKDMAPLLTVFKGLQTELSVKLITEVCERCPAAVLFFVRHSSDLYEIDPKAPWDTALLVATMAFVTNFINNQAVRVFMQGVALGVQSVNAETAAAQS
jgi:hypothetical protein